MTTLEELKNPETFEECFDILESHISNAIYAADALDIPSPMFALELILISLHFAKDVGIEEHLIPEMIKDVYQ